MLETEVGDTCYWHLGPLLLHQGFLDLTLLCHLSVGNQKHEQQFAGIRYAKQQLSNIYVVRSFIYFQPEVAPQDCLKSCL